MRRVRRCASSDARAEQKNDIFLKQLKAFHDDFEKLIDERQKEMEAWRKSEDADEEFHEFSDHGIDPDEVERINQMEPDISLAYETLHPSLKKLLQGAPSSDFASKKLDWEVRMAEMKAKCESSATLLREGPRFSSVKERRRTYTRKMSSQRRPSARKASSLERLEDFVDAARNADLTAQDAITSLQCFHFLATSGTMPQEHSKLLLGVLAIITRAIFVPPPSQSADAVEPQMYKDLEKILEDDIEEKQLHIRALKSEVGLIRRDMQAKVDELKKIENDTEKVIADHSTLAALKCRVIKRRVEKMRVELDKKAKELHERDEIVGKLTNEVNELSQKLYEQKQLRQSYQFALKEAREELERPKRSESRMIETLCR